MSNNMQIPYLQVAKRRRINLRKQTILTLVITLGILIAVTIAGICSGEAAVATSFTQKNLVPSAEHIFGTDWLGRDMLARTLKGLSISILIGLAASVISTLIALLLGTLAATLGKAVDFVVTWLCDLLMGLPHLLLLILISFALGKGTIGVIVAVALSHWPSLTRVLRGEILQIREAQYVKVARKLGHSNWKIAVKHIFPHIFPQMLVGLILMFPHAILHEASITFLGFGLPPEQPGVGNILSESMTYLSMGMWWLSVFPGVCLLAVVILFDFAGGNLRKLIDPFSSQD